MIKSLSQLESVIDLCSKCNNWTIQLLNIKNTVKNGTTYIGREIVLHPDDKLNDFVKEIDTYYVKEKNLERYKEICAFDGVNIENRISYISIDNPLISDQFIKFKNAINKPNVDGSLEIKDFKGYVLTGSIGEEKKEIHLVSILNPIISYKKKHNFIIQNNSFKEITGNILRLKIYIDAIIYDGFFYMFNMSAEKLFNMERSYKKICEQQVEKMERRNIFSDFEKFKQVATSGNRPRKFVSYRQENFDLLVEDIGKRIEIAGRFDIKMTDDDKFDTSEDKSNDNLVKVLCSKAALEPFHNSPVEVESARKWGS